MVRNEVTKKFEPVEGIEIDGRFKIHYLGNEKVLFFGDYYSGKDKNGEKVFGGVCIWDIASNTLEHVSNHEGFGTLRNYSVTNDNVVFACNGGVWIMLPGTSVWAEQYQQVKQGGSFHQVLGIDEKNAYATWRRSDDAKYFLMKLNAEKKWEPIAEFSKPDVGTTSVSLDFKTTGLARYKEYVIVSHTGTHLNGKPTGLINAYNTITKEWKSVPVPSGINSDNMGYIHSVGDSVYFITTHEVLFGTQKIYLLEFTQSTAWHYSFTGNGTWSNDQNWAYGFKPPASLPSGKTIVINPAGEGECVLDVQQTIETNAVFQVAPGKRFRVVGDLIIGN